MTSEAENNGLAILLGAGPGDAALVTVEGVKWLSRADTVIYDRLANPKLLDLAPPSAERIYVGKQPGSHALSQEQINALLVEKTREGKIVVRLKGGDSFIFGRGGEEATALAEAECPMRIVPGVTAAVAAAAYAGVPLTDRRFAGTVALVTGHEDPTKGEPVIDYAALAGIDTVVFYMGVANLPEIAEKLIATGKTGETPAAIITNAATPQQRTVPATLADLADCAARADVRPPAIIIVGEVAEMHGRLGWYEKLPLYGKTILVTRSTGRVSRLADKLAELGAEVIESPAIEIHPPEDYTAVDAILDRLGRFDWVVFTSPHGPAAVTARMAELQLDARRFAGAKIAAVGDATAAELLRHNLRADLVAEPFTTEALGEALIAAGAGGQAVLLARSDIAPPDLPQALAAAGAKVTDVAVYRTVRPAGLPPSAREALKEGRVDWIIFTSASTVDNFLALVGDADISAVKLAAIGPVTAAALEKHNLQPAAVADLSGPATLAGRSLPEPAARFAETSVARRAKTEPHTIDALVDAILAAESPTS
jgi:uroporphyrinogen III methyltransferase/synthase